MPREEECVTNEEIILLHSGKRFRPNKKRIVAEREGNNREIKERDTDVIIHIEGIMNIEENIKQFSLVEDDPTQIRLYVELMTPCESPRTEVRSKTLSIIVSEGSK